MDSTSKVRSRDEVADLLVEMLTHSGKLADLEHTDLETMEEEVLATMDEITRDTLSKLLHRQQQQTKAPQACPRCGQALNPKPAQGRSMQSRRGRIHFKCDVFRCEACRLDFFPSVQHAGL